MFLFVFYLSPVKYQSSDEEENASDDSDFPWESTSGRSYIKGEKVNVTI